MTGRWESSAVIAETDIYPFMVEAAGLGGRMYGVPYDYNSTVYFVNLDLLAQAGLNPPAENWTVDDLRDMSRKITNEQWGTWHFPRSRLRLGLQHPVVQELDRPRLDRRSRRYGASQLPAALEMLEWWYESQYSYGITPWPGGFPRPGRRGRRAAGLTKAGWTPPNFPEHMTFDWTMALYPKAPAGQGNFAQGHMFSVAAEYTNKDAAWKVLEWMVSYEGQEAIIQTTRRQPIGPYGDLWALTLNSCRAERGPRSASGC